MHFICSDLDNGNVCPACPKVSVFVSYTCMLSSKVIIGIRKLVPVHGCLIWATSQEGCWEKSQGAHSWSLFLW